MPGGHGLGLLHGGRRCGHGQDEHVEGHGHDAHAEALLPGTRDRTEPGHVVLVVARPPSRWPRGRRRCAGRGEGRSGVLDPPRLDHGGGDLGRPDVRVGLELPRRGEAGPRPAQRGDQVPRVPVLVLVLVPPETGQDLVGVVVARTGHRSGVQIPGGGQCRFHGEQHRVRPRRHPRGEQPFPGAGLGGPFRVPEQRFVPAAVARGVEERAGREVEAQGPAGRVLRELRELVGSTPWA